ncbi:MAG TPA: DUF6789 family protein [Chloroflexota bacterium]|nr:DUF6789 family protein [Chloroflexota bacterium]
MLERLLRGALGGLLATAIMSAVMFGARALGLLHTPPPKEITARAGRKAGAEPRRQSADTFNATWLAAHLGFGLGCGVVFALLRPYVPGGRSLPGLVYGALIWATS